MLEPLSEPIRKLLLELKLCSANDLRRCRRHVRRLTYDLPAFDSIWLDALVQIGRLTPFQARILESSDPRALKIGPCVAIRRLGDGPHSQTLLARSAESHELCVAKILSNSDQVSEEIVERLEQLVQRTKDLEHPSVVAPLSCVHFENRIVLISRYIAGPQLAELLVRRGRFPAGVVWDIGRQLVEGLAALDERKVAHGDIRAANVRLTAAGTAVLVDSGVRPAIAPILTVHAGLAPDRYDGVAPELIGGSATPNALSDAYAVGCLLWQLLAGRPPFPGGDPLVKLAAHQTRTIDDVRKWAPDTPPALAEGIRRMTARNPAERPTSFAEIVWQWQAPARSGRRKLSAFRRRFDSPSRLPPTARRLSTPTRWLLLLAVLFAVSGGAVTLADKGARSVVLAWAAQWSRTQPDDVPDREEIKTRSPNFDEAGTKPLVEDSDSLRGLSLPPPDPQGVIRLAGRGPWLASDITAVGELTIVGNKEEPPQIVIDERPLKLWAESVRLMNVRIGVRPERSARPPKLNALLLVEAQVLALEGCVFDASAVAEMSTAGSSESAPPLPVITPPTGPALIGWKLLDPREQRGGTATIRNTLLLGDGPGLYLAHAVRQVEFDNVLKLGASPLVQLAAVPSSKSKVVLRLAHTTCRASGALLRWIVPPAGGAAAGQILVEAADCVFDVVSPRAALFELVGSEARPEWLRSLKMTGEGSISRPTLDVAAWISTDARTVIPLESSSFELEGIFVGPFRFAGELGSNPADAEVRDSEAPRRTNDLPGIRAGELPGS